MVSGETSDTTRTYRWLYGLVVEPRERAGTSKEVPSLKVTFSTLEPEL